MAKTKVAPHPSLGKNIALLMEAMKDLASQPALAKKAGVAQSTVGRIIRGEVSPSTDNLRKIANAFGISVSNLLFDTDDFLAGIRNGSIKLRGADDEQGGVAHDLSQARNSESLPKVKWEDLMTADLSRPFELEVLDDALADEIVKGSVARFHPAGSRAPIPGRPVLLRDRDGNYYLRDFAQGPGQRWKALARKSGFTPMDSEEHGLEIIAVMKGVDWS